MLRGERRNEDKERHNKRKMVSKSLTRYQQSKHKSESTHNLNNLERKRGCRSRVGAKEEAREGDNSSPIRNEKLLQHGVNELPH